MAHYATVNLWSLELTKRLWGPIGTLTDPSDLVQAIGQLRISLLYTSKHLHESILARVDELIRHYADDLTRGLSFRLQ